MFAIAGLLRKQGEPIAGSVPRGGSKVQCGLRLSPQNGIIATHMKKTDIAALAGAALFTAVALVGLVLGRDWKLLLVPLFLLPTIRFFAADSTTKEVVSGSAPASTVFTVREIMLALVATAGAFAFSARFATGKCVWSAGAMTAAMSAISTIHLFSGTFRHRALFAFCMLGAASSYAIVAFATSGDVDATGFGALFVVPVFAVARAWLGVRDGRKGAAA